MGPLTSFESESISETMNPFKYIGRTPWTGDQPIAKPLPPQDSTTQKSGHVSMPRDRTFFIMRNMYTIVCL